MSLLSGIAAHLRRGGLIAYPTEYCYGLGCDPRSRVAVQQLLKLKRRPQKKGLILIAGKFRQIAPYLQPLTLREQDTLRRDGVQAITYLMPVKSDVPRWLRGVHDTLAVRLTAHPQAATLCNALHMALVSTSDNRSGQRPARTAKECLRLFGNQVWVLPGKVGQRDKPSTIRAWVSGKILRK